MFEPKSRSIFDSKVDRGHGLPVALLVKLAMLDERRQKPSKQHGGIVVSDHQY
jgi:hypothetical protein